MLSRLLLVGGLGAAAAWLLPAIPREHTLVVVFGPGQSKRIRRVELSWSPEGAPAPLGGATFAYEPRTEPSKLRQKILAPNGNYVVSFAVERDGSIPRQSEFERRVRLQGEETTVFIEGALK